MDNPLNVLIYDQQRPVYSADLPGPLEIGRQSKDEPAPYHQRPQGPGWRLVIARPDEDFISRKHVLVEPLPAGRARVTNLSDVRPVSLRDGTQLKPKTSCETALPLVLTPCCSPLLLTPTCNILPACQQ